MTAGIVGLGLIGGSFEKAFRAAGHDVAFSAGSYENIKITTPEDIAVAESIMKARKSE